MMKKSLAVAALCMTCCGQLLAAEALGNAGDSPEKSSEKILAANSKSKAPRHFVVKAQEDWIISELPTPGDMFFQVIRIEAPDKRFSMQINFAVFPEEKRQSDTPAQLKRMLVNTSAVFYDYSEEKIHNKAQYLMNFSPRGYYGYMSAFTNPAITPPENSTQAWKYIIVGIYHLSERELASFSLITNDLYSDETRKIISVLGDLADAQSIPDVKVQNAAQAIEIAQQIFRKDKSQEFIDQQKPFSATYKEGNWFVSGYCFDHNRQLQIMISAVSGTAAIESVAKSDGKMVPNRDNPLPAGEKS
ncbi:MAG: hypothetical protein RR060_07070, partial [Victivallaceae bacterium]